jgi:hypothetical protein
VRVLLEVVREPDVDSACSRSGHRVAQLEADGTRQADVVDRYVERALCRRDPARERVDDLVGGLPAVAERAELDQDAFAAARASAFLARFAT